VIIIGHKNATTKYLNHIEVIEKYSLSKGGEQRSPIDGVKFGVLCFWWFRDSNQRRKKGEVRL